LTEQGVQWDPQGRPYYNTSDGRRDYIPPVVAAQFRDDARMQAWAKAQGATLASDPGGITAGSSVPGGGYLHGRGEWDSEEGRYRQPINGGNLLATGIGAAIGAPWLASALGPGATAAAGSNASIEGVLAGNAAIDSAITSGLAGVGTVSPVAAGGASLGKKLWDAVTSPGGIASLASLVPVALAATRGSGTSPDAQADLDQARRLSAITEARMRRVDPLHEAVTQLAFGRLPTRSRDGLALTRIALPPAER
jgi:hypothetical protein